MRLLLLQWHKLAASCMKSQGLHPARRIHSYRGAAARSMEPSAGFEATRTQEELKPPTSRCSNKQYRRELDERYETPCARRLAGAPLISLRASPQPLLQPWNRSSVCGHRRARPPRILDLARSLLDRCRHRSTVAILPLYHICPMGLSSSIKPWCSPRDEPRRPRFNGHECAQTRKPAATAARPRLHSTFYIRVEAYLDCTCRSSTTYC